MISIFNLLRSSLISFSLWFKINGAHKILVDCSCRGQLSWVRTSNWAKGREFAFLDSEGLWPDKKLARVLNYSWQDELKRANKNVWQLNERNDQDSVGCTSERPRIIQDDSSLLQKRHKKLESSHNGASWPAHQEVCQFRYVHLCASDVGSTRANSNAKGMPSLVRGESSSGDGSIFFTQDCQSINLSVHGWKQNYGGRSVEDASDPV